MDYQVYEILLLFAIYSIAGWVIEVFLFILQNRGLQNRGVCYGPYLISFGFGALAVLYGLSYLERDFNLEPAVRFCAVFAIGTAAGLLLYLGSASFINGFCGSKVIRFKWYYPILAGFGALIVVFQVNPLLVALIRRIPSWMHMIFLLLYWTRVLPELVDGMRQMKKFKKKHTFHKTAE